jgi:DNA ligase (NAD+)
MKPVIVFEPVNLTGVTITRSSGYNAKNVVDNGMGVGAVVLITRQGDVIPRVDSVIVPSEVEIPDGCIWDENKVELLAPETEENRKLIATSKLEYFFGKMEIDFIGAGNIAKLNDAGIVTAVQAIQNMDKFEGIIGENGRKGAIIMKEKLLNCTPELLFAALGTFGRGIGERKLKVLFAAIPYEEILNGDVSVATITAVEGFEVASANKIVTNSLVSKITHYAIKEYIKFVKVEKNIATSGKFLGELICATGVRLDDSVIQQIQAQGGEVTESFGKKVTLLIAKDPTSNSGKAAKARTMGIKIISLSSLQGML